MNEFIIELQAKLNEEKSKENINGDIGEIQKQLDKLKLKAEIDQDTISKLTKEIEKVITKKITISNIEINPASVTKSAQQTGEQIGNIISKSANKAISRASSKSIGKYFKIDSSTSDKLNSEMEKLVNKWTKSKGKLTDIKINTRTSFDEESGENITRLHQVLVTYKNELDEVIQKTIAWRQIGVTTNENGEEEILRGFVEVAGQYSKSIDAVSAKTDNFAKKQKETVANMQNTIKQITSRAFDPHTSKPITSEDSLKRLNTQVAYVENAMYDLKHATADTFDDANIKVQNEISELKNLEKKLRNADAVLSKQKDFSAIKIEESNKLDTFVQKMEQSGHYTDELKNKVSMLRADLSNVFDENSLANYLNGLSNLKNEFQKVDATAKTSEKESNQLVKKLEKSYQTIKNLEIKKDALDVSKDINQITELDEQLKTAKKDFDSLFKQTSSNSNFNISKWDEAKSAIDAATQNQIKNNNAKKRDVLDSSINKTSDNLNKLKSEWQEQGLLVGEFKIKVEELEKKLFSIGNQNELRGLKSQIEDLEKEAAKIEQIKDIKNSISDNGDVSTQITVLRDNFTKLGLSADEVTSKMNSVDNEIKELKALLSSGADNSAITTQFEKIQNVLKETQNDLKATRSEYSLLVSAQQRLSKANVIEAWNQKNPKATKEVISENNSYIESLRNLNSQMTEMQFNEIVNGFKKSENSMRGINRLGVSLTNQFKEAAKSITQTLSIGSGAILLVNKLWEIPQEVIKVNSAMVELNKVSNASASDIRNYFDEAAESAKRYGSSVSDMINATADWSRLGYNLPDAKQLAEVATLYTNVGDGINIDTANQSLISTLQGFQLEAEDAMDIIDKFNEVANSFPIDSAGIGEALQRSAASFHAANTDLSKSIALITGTNSVVQDPSRVGNMWKTVSMRIRGTKQELEAAGEDTDGMVESTAQLRDLVKGLTGFDIMADAAGTQFKDIYDIVVGIGKEWKDLTDVEQAGLLETLAGKMQSNALSAALSNVSMIEEAYKTAENSAGSALKEQETYEQGIEYSLARLEASFQSFANHVLDSGFLKGIVDFGNGIINVLDAVTSKLESLGTIGALSGLLMNIKGVGEHTVFQW